jgi:hypothetical protein
MLLCTFLIWFSRLAVVDVLKSHILHLATFRFTFLNFICFILRWTVLMCIFKVCWNFVAKGHRLQDNSGRSSESLWNRSLCCLKVLLFARIFSHTSQGTPILIYDLHSSATASQLTTGSCCADSPCWISKRKHNVPGTPHIKQAIQYTLPLDIMFIKFKCKLIVIFWLLWTLALVNFWLTISLRKKWCSPIRLCCDWFLHLHSITSAQKNVVQKAKKKLDIFLAKYTALNPFPSTFEQPNILSYIFISFLNTTALSVC